MDQRSPAGPDPVLPPDELPGLVRGRGRPIVYLPGLSLAHDPPLGLSGLLDRTLMRPLTRRFEVHWMGRRMGVPDGYSIEDFAADAATAISALFPHPVPVVGFSTGGLVALQLAVDHPEVVDRIVVIGAGPRLSPHARISEQRWAAYLEQGRPDAAWRELAEDVTRFPPAQSLLAATLARVGPWLTPTDVSDGVATARADVAFDATGSVAGIRCPTLFVIGLSDPSCELPVIQRARDAIPSGQLLALPRTGHLASALHPRGIRRIRQFLAAPLP